MIKFLLRKKLVKNVTQANFLLLAISFFCFSLSIYISNTFILNRNIAKKLTPEQEVQRQEFLNRSKASLPPLSPKQPL